MVNTPLVRIARFSSKWLPVPSLQPTTDTLDNKPPRQVAILIFCVRVAERRVNLCLVVADAFPNSSVLVRRRVQYGSGGIVARAQRVQDGSNSRRLAISTLSRYTGCWCGRETGPAGRTPGEARGSYQSHSQDADPMAR